MGSSFNGWSETVRLMIARGMTDGGQTLTTKYPPSQTGQHCPGTFLGLEHLVSHSMDLHSAFPLIHVQIVQSFSGQVALLCTISPDLVIQPETK